jgi:Fe-S cluster assembly ATP-binding protein
MGPNGSGKSTLSYVLAGREGYEVTGGSATFDGQDLLAMEPEERAAAGVFLPSSTRWSCPASAMPTSCARR